MSDTPATEPDVTPCPFCQRDGRHDPTTHSTYNCPGWVSVSDLAFADLKGMLAVDGLIAERRRG